MFENFLNPIFDPLLKLPTLWAVVILSLVITLIITLIYKYTTNQDLMKQLKDEMKETQKKMKELRNNPSEMMKMQKQAMQANMKYMGSSMKSTLYTFIPIILIFGWMNSNLAYEPILPDKEFTTTVSLYENIEGNMSLGVPEGIAINGEPKKAIESNEVKWALKGQEGGYLLEYRINERTYTKDLLIGNAKKYAPPVKLVKDKTIKQISIDSKKIIVLNLFGWKLGWLGSYIILSIIVSMILRKLFKVY